jgi:hypothetical protein
MSLSAAAPARHLAVIPDLRGLGQPALIVETAISRFSSADAIFVPVREVRSSLSERSGAKSRTTATSENLLTSVRLEAVNDFAESTSRRAGPSNRPGEKTVVLAPGLPRLVISQAPS